MRLLQLRRWHGLQLRDYFGRFAGLLAATGVMASVMGAMLCFFGDSVLPLVVMEVVVGAKVYVATAAVTAIRITADVRSALVDLRR